MKYSKQGNHNICIDDINYKDNDTAANVKVQLNRFIEEISSIKNDVKMVADCQIPCNELKFEIIKTKQRVMDWTQYWLQAYNKF